MKILNIREHPELRESAAAWFHEKWGVPQEAYLESIDACISGGGAVPQWYVMVDGDHIAAGMGVIKNDFHERTDLAPNVCAVFTEPEYRCRGFAGELLGHVCGDMDSFGVGTLYLVTDHTSFYERYGWEFLCMVNCDDGASRMYVHKMS